MVPWAQSAVASVVSCHLTLCLLVRDLGERLGRFGASTPTQSSDCSVGDASSSGKDRRLLGKPPFASVAGRIALHWRTLPDAGE